MWTLNTSEGPRLASIGCEEAARRNLHTLGTTQWRGPLFLGVVDYDGRRFVTEVRHLVEAGRP